MTKGIEIPLIVDPKEAISGLNAVEGKSTSVASVLSGLGGAAAAGVLALGTAAIAAAGALTAATLSAGAYAEDVQLAASTTHLTTDAVQELQYASKVTGVSFETISGSLTKLTKSMGAAQEGSGAQAEAFARLGVATTDANGNLLDSTAVYAQVISALGQVENPAERDVLAMQLLGKSATELNPLIDGSAGSLADLAAQAHEAGAVLSTDMLAKLSSVDDAFDTLQAGADAAKNALGLTLMPILQELGTEGTGLLGDFTNAVLNADGDLSKAAPAIGEVFGNAASFLLTQIPKFLEVGTSIVTNLITGIASQLPALVTQAVPILVGFVSTLLGQLPLLLDAGIKVLVALVQGIITSLPTLIPAAVNAVIGLASALVDNLPMLIEAGIQLVLALAVGIVEALPKIYAKLPMLIEGIITALVEAIPQLVMAGVQLLLALVQNLPAIIEGIIAAVPAIIDALVTALGDPKFWAQLGDAGFQLISGLWEGIKRAGDWLWRQMQGFFGGVIDKIKALFGIHSPSTVFAEFGRNMILGWEGGLTGPNHLGSIVSDLSREITDGMGASIAVRARASLDGSYGPGPAGVASQAPVINQYIQILPEQDPRIVARQFGREYARTMAGA